MPMNNIICIAGPTASGKTALAVELAKEFHGEVISCDSMQIYRRMDIGTAKPPKEEMQGIPHHMLDIAEPEEDFSPGAGARHFNVEVVQPEQVSNRIAAQRNDTLFFIFSP